MVFVDIMTPDLFSLINTLVCERYHSHTSYGSSASLQAPPPPLLPPNKILIHTLPSFLREKIGSQLVIGGLPRYLTSHTVPRSVGSLLCYMCSETGILVSVLHVRYC